MAFQISPGVNVTEKDLTLGVRGVSTSKAAFAGFFGWGPVEQRVLVSSEDNLAQRFGKPTNFNAEYWFSAANFFAYSNAMEVVRAINDAVNATSSGVGKLVKNEDHYETVVLTDDNAFIAKYPGSLGNGIKVSIGTSANFATWAYKNAFDTAPLAEEIHVAIVDGDGKWTGLANSILEVYPYLSTVAGTRSEDGSNIYYKDVINNQSSYVWVGGEFQLSTDSVTENVAVAKASYTTEETFLAQTGAVTLNLAFDLQATTKVLITGSVTGVIAEVSRDDVANTIDIVADAGGEDVTVTLLNHGTFNVVLSTETFDGDDSVSVVFAGQTLVEGTDYTSTAPATIAIDPYATAAVTNAIDLSTATTTAAVTISGQDEYDLSGGSDDTAVVNRNTAYDLFTNSELVDISLIISGPANSTETNHLITLAETRKDVVAFFSPEKSAVVNNPGSEKDDIIAYVNSPITRSSYAFMDGNWKYQYDKYNDVYRWVPLNGDIAGLAANTDNVADPWFSPAGYNRGLIRNVVKLAWNPDKANRDELYKNGINPVITEAGQGTLLLGDKTLLARPSAFGRINVRRLFIVLEKAIANAAKYQLFEFNDEFTRAQFVNIVEPYLRDVQGRRGITDFVVVCDTRNNTPQVIDNNEFVGDIYIKPARSINFIQLNFVAVRTGVSFEEIIGS